MADFRRLTIKEVTAMLDDSEEPVTAYTVGGR